MTVAANDSREDMSGTWTAADVKAALRGRHPAAPRGSMAGQWVCIEEWREVDLLALSAWSDASVIGYEVKVSRSDLRQELLRPRKRAEAVAMCTEFYFAVPKGMLTAEELAYEEPEWEPDDFHRMRCPGIARFGPPDPYAARRHRPADLLDRPPGRYGGPCRGRGHTGSYKAGTREKGPFRVPLPLPMTCTEAPSDYVTTKWERVGEPNANGIYETARVPLEGDELVEALARWMHERVSDAESRVPCPACGGKGYLNRSRVEVEAPTLWCPRDVGLIEVDGRGCRVARKSPKRPKAPGLLSIEVDPRHGDGVSAARRRRQRLHQLIRWTSVRPDPRHAVTVAAREAA